jgi:hypothetical protein
MESVGLLPLVRMNPRSAGVFVFASMGKKSERLETNRAALNMPGATLLGLLQTTGCRQHCIQ